MIPEAGSRTSLRLRVLDVALALSGPPAVIEPVRSAYRRFVGERGEGPAASEVRIDLRGATLRAGDRVVPLIADLDPTLQVYQQTLALLMNTIGSHAVLHAAALVDSRGDAVLLAAPSGHGKSSLTLELARRGLGFLSDDFAPLDLAGGRIAPYPRAVGVVPREDSPIPAPFLARALDPSCPRLFGKSLVDVGEVLGEQAMRSEPAPLRRVILLAASGASLDGPTRTWLHLGSRSEDAADLERALSAVAGVEVSERGEHPHLATWRLRIDHRAGPTRALSRVLDDPRVLFCEKYWEERPDFRATPRATAVRRRVAAEHLGRELLNRRETSRLLARFAGGLPELFLALAGALRPVSCWRIEAGEYHATADLVEEILERD